MHKYLCQVYLAEQKCISLNGICTIVLWLLFVWYMHYAYSYSPHKYYECLHFPEEYEQKTDMITMTNDLTSVNKPCNDRIYKTGGNEVWLSYMRGQEIEFNKVCSHKKCHIFRVGGDTPTQKAIKHFRFRPAATQ